MIVEPAADTDQERIRRVLEKLRTLPGQEAAAASFEALLSRKPEQERLSDTESWLFLLAATLASFTLVELQAFAIPTIPSPAELSSVLERSLAVAGLKCGEASRYVLIDEVRRNVLRERRGSRVEEALAATATSSDPTTQVLHILLARWNRDVDLLWTDADLDGMSAPEMETATRAASLILDVWPTLRPVHAEMRRRLDLEEILAPLRLLIGKVGPVGSGGGPDAFVGRDNELISLYDHVGVVPPRSLLDRARRSLTALVQTVTGVPAGALVVHGIGGMGKSALMAKFVLDHAGERALAFAYLDFDRSTLMRAGTSALLVEVTRQIGLQLDSRRIGEAAASAAGSRLQELRANLRSDISMGADRDFARQADLLRHILDDFPGHPTVLIVLDTMERVQSLGTEGIAPVRELLARLGLFSRGWDRLRVVACSRIDVPELHGTRGTPSPIELKALPSGEAALMVEAMLRQQAPDRTFVSELIAATVDAAQGYPLFIRAMTSHLVAAGLELDVDLLRQLQSARGQASRIATVFYARFADRVTLPGGVETFRAATCLRVVTRPLLAAVLAGFGSGLSSAEIDQSFATLSADATLWSKDDRGETLRWLPDLRALLLGCIRQEGDGLARGARFAWQALTTPQPDDALAADLLYYCLLAGGSVSTADTFWRPSRDFRNALVDTAQDFPPDSVAACYLRLVAARRRPSVAELDQLPPNLGWQLSWRAVPDLAAPSLAGVEPTIHKLMRNALDAASEEPADKARRVALLAKTGRWREARKRADGMGDDLAVDKADLLGWMTRAIPPDDRPGRSRMLRLAWDLVSSWAPGEKPAPAWQAPRGEGLVAALVAARLEGDENLFKKADMAVAKMDIQRLRPENLGANVIVLGSFAKLATETAVEFADQGKVFAAVSTQQLLLLRDTCRVTLPNGSELERIWDFPDSPSNGRAPPARAWTDAAILRAALIALRDLRYGWRDAESRWAFFRSFFALRSPDWIEPLAYAIAEGQDQALLAAASQLLDEGALKADKVLLSRMSQWRSEPDAGELLRTLDEASALGPCLSILRKRIDEGPSLVSRVLGGIRSSPASEDSRGEFAELLRAFDHWQRAKEHRGRELAT
jgi:hypothetical protein